MVQLLACVRIGVRFFKASASDVGNETIYGPFHTDRFNNIHEGRIFCQTSPSFLSVFCVGRKEFKTFRCTWSMRVRVSRKSASQLPPSPAAAAPTLSCARATCTTNYCQSPFFFFFGVEWVIEYNVGSYNDAASSSTMLIQCNALRRSSSSSICTDQQSCIFFVSWYQTVSRA